MSGRGARVPVQQKPAEAKEDAVRDTCAARDTAACSASLGVAGLMLFGCETHLLPGAHRLVSSNARVMGENRTVVISEQTLQSLDKLIAVTESLTDNLARANRSYER